jgi:hypothetical protein
MPYPMTHLCIAKNLLEYSILPIENEPQFYLGSLAPDSVQFRKEYNKKHSHICISEEPWGFVTNNDEWECCVINFIKENYGKIDINFLLGYGIHILADIQNNIKIWTPYRINNSGKNFKELHKIVFEENMLIDQNIYQKYISKTQIFELLKISKELDFLNMVNKEDMENIKNSILNIQYIDKNNVKIENEKINKFNEIIDFINSTTEYIIEIFKNKII